MSLSARCAASEVCGERARSVAPGATQASLSVPLHCVCSHPWKCQRRDVFFANAVVFLDFAFGAAGCV